MIISLMMALGNAPAMAADPQLPSGFLIKNWTASDGVPHNTVRCIVESRMGYLWLGTANGLARFDGVRFVTFDRVNSPLMGEDDIWDLHEADSGTIWYRTRRGLGSFRDGLFDFQETGHTGRFALLDSFIADAEGQLWLRGVNGLARIEEDGLEVAPLPANAPETLTDVCSARNGGFWLAAEDALWRLQDESLVRVHETSGLMEIVEGPGGRLWALKDDSLLLEWVDGNWIEQAQLDSERCFQLYPASNGDIWIAAENEPRVFRFRNGTVTEVSNDDGLLGNRPICFAEDLDGNIWSGLNAGGLYQLRERQIHVYGRGDGLQGLNAASIAQLPDETIMVNVMGRTLHQFAGNRFHPIPVQTSGPPFEDPTALMPAGDGGIWSGTFYGELLHLHNGRETRRQGTGTGTRSLFTDRQGRLWRGTRTEGIEVFSGTHINRYSTTDGLSFDNVYCFAQAADGAVWAGTEKGLNRIQDGHIQSFGLEDGLRHPFVSSLCVDSRGTLWAGTLGGGLSAWNGSRFITLTTGQGLVHNHVEQLLEDGLGHLWLGTRIGLMRVSLDQLHDFIDGKQELVTGTLISEDEGLKGPNFWTEYQPASLKAQDGRLWFCTGRGVVVIDPSRFTSTASPPIVHIETITTGGIFLPFEPATGLRVPAGTERVEIRYTGISLSRPDQVRFQYQLDGYDRDWVEAGHTRTASYSHLPPGHYDFKVRAVNNDGVWNLAGASLPISIQPAYWQTFWFRGLLVILALGMIALLYIWRVNGLERRRLAQENFSRRLIDSQEQERKRIAAELHDSLGQNLLVIKNRADLALAQRNMPQKMTAQVDEVAAMASNAIREVRSIAQNLRPFQIDELGVTKAIAAMARNLGEVSSIQFQITLEPIDSLLPPEFEISFYRIVQECLNNIVKHARARNAVVRLVRSEKSIHLTVSDDGNGFDPEGEQVRHTGSGLGNIIERTRTLGGRVSIRSQLEHGTQIEIQVPVRI